MHPINPLSQGRYAISTVIADVGWLSRDEIKDITAQIDGGRCNFDGHTQQLHLYWEVLADTMDEVIDLSRAMLRRARDASNVCSPRTIAFDIREIDNRTT